MDDTPLEDDRLALGEVAAVGPSGAVTITVHEVLDPSAEGAPVPESAGTYWVSVDVELCNDMPEGSTFSGEYFKLVDTDNRHYMESQIGYQQFPQPTYALGTPEIGAGECVRVWITYPVNEGAELVSVRYQPRTGGPFVWAIPKQDPPLPQPQMLAYLRHRDRHARGYPCIGSGCGRPPHSAHRRGPSRGSPRARCVVAAVLRRFGTCTISGSWIGRAAPRSRCS